MTPPYLLTATQVRNLLENNIITVEEYACSLLDRIEKRDGIVKAWAYLGKSSLPAVDATVPQNLYADFPLDPAFILDQARALDKIPRDQRGPLHGLAVGIKDIINTKGMKLQLFTSSIKSLMLI